jgi:uncharacterized protein YutE (UPF0331/DUF86 family)
VREPGRGLQPVDIQDLIELNLQRAVQAAIDLAHRLRRMTGFRNIAVHEYDEMDPRVVAAIVDHHLDDLRELARTILARFRLDPGTVGT